MTTINIIMIAIMIIRIDIIIIISRKMSSYRRTIRMTAAPPLAGGALKLQGEKKTFVISELVRTFISFIIWGSYEYHPLSSGIQAVCHPGDDIHGYHSIQIEEEQVDMIPIIIVVIIIVVVIVIVKTVFNTTIFTTAVDATLFINIGTHISTTPIRLLLRGG